ncbi:hypothetical protein ACFL96_01040 [Thermoproteota archaeon]
MRSQPLTPNQSPPTYHVDISVNQNWGELVDVFNQQTSQRLTFDSEIQITVVEIGLVWHPSSKTYKPDIRQIIIIPKYAPEQLTL